MTMKLKQQTLFQCFVKTTSKSSHPSIIKDESGVNIPFTRQVQSTTENNPSETVLSLHSEQLNFLLPIHIRQSNDLSSSSSNNIPLFETRRISSDSLPCAIDKEFFRICPQIDEDQSHSSVLEVHRIIEEISSYRCSFSLFSVYLSIVRATNVLVGRIYHFKCIH